MIASNVSHLDHARLPIRVGFYTAHAIGLRVGQGGPLLLHHSRLRVGPF
jgi:hypothetical protein